MPILASSLGSLGIMYTYLPIQMYLTDAYTTCAASANSACTISRSICGGLLALAMKPQYIRLGYGWGNSLLAFVALVLVPLTFLLSNFGKSIRTNARFQPDL